MQNVDSQLRKQALECPYLYGDNDFTEELEKFAKCELNEDEETRVRCLEELRSRLRDEPGLLWLDNDQFLLAFLRARKFSVDRTLSLLKKFYSSTGKYANVYYSIDREDVKKVLLQNCLYFLPQRDSDGSSICIFRFSGWDPKLVSTEMLIGVSGLCILHVLRQNSAQIVGFKVIMDYEGFSLKQLTSVRPWHLWLAGEMMQNTFPYRVRSLHMVNQNRFFYGLWVVWKQFLSKKLTERVHFHFNKEKSLHKFIDPRILPAEYGGEKPSFDNSDMRRLIEESGAYSEYVLSFGYQKYIEKFPQKNKWQRNTVEENITSGKV